MAKLYESRYLTYQFFELTVDKNHKKTSLVFYDILYLKTRILIYFITKINKDGKKFFMGKKNQNNWLIYILECVDGSLYCGITNNLERRLKQHKGEIKGGAKYTRSHWPCRLVYKEKSASRSEASQREAIIKKMSKDEKQALIN